MRTPSLFFPVCTTVVGYTGMSQMTQPLGIFNHSPSTCSCVSRQRAYWAQISYSASIIYYVIKSRTGNNAMQFLWKFFLLVSCAHAPQWLAGLEPNLQEVVWNYMYSGTCLSGHGHLDKAVTSLIQPQCIYYGMQPGHLSIAYTSQLARSPWCLHQYKLTCL